MFKLDNMIAVKNENSDTLGKLLYFSLSNVLILKEDIAKIIESLGLPVNTTMRNSDIDAFRSATGDIYERKCKKSLHNIEVFKIYCRDNKRDDKNIIRRELVKETLENHTNEYDKLANIFFEKQSETFNYDVYTFDSDVDVISYCQKAEELFSLYKRCYGRSQIENLTDAILKTGDALKISVHGKVYFLPRKSVHVAALFEDFIEAVNKSKIGGQEITCNSIYIMNDPKQRDKMTAEFYHNIRKEVEFYQERISNLISSGSQSAAIMDRWVNKVTFLEKQKAEYEELLQRELSDIDDEFSTLRFLSQELQLRAKKITQRKCA